MKKILIAIDNDFIREAYSEVFKKEEFTVLETKKGKKALDLAKKEKPDVALLDILLSEIGGFELLEVFKKENSTKKIPVVIFTQLEKRQDRQKAMELEAKDFVTAASISPTEIIRRVKIVLGEQKSYRLKVSKDTNAIKELMKDLDYRPDLSCSKCGANLELCLIRDLSKGRSHFIVSFVCPNCD